jgi:hypothetical protein
MIISDFPGGGSDKVINVSKVSVLAKTAITKGDSLYMTLNDSVYWAYTATSGAVSTLITETTYYIGYALSDIASGSTGNAKIIERVSAVSDVQDSTITLANAALAMTQ